MSTLGDRSKAGPHYEPRIALVHDELTRRGGAEMVFEQLAALYPSADLYSLYAGTPLLRSGDMLRVVHTSFLQSLPLWFRRHPSRLLPLLPQAAEQFDLSEYDAVISSASGFAKGIVTRVGVPHICYCHAPTRYLWDAAHAVLHGRALPLRLGGSAVQHVLRLFDYSAAQRVDYFIANSRYTQERILRYYRRESTVIYPPIVTSFFTPGRGERGDYFLCVGRLSPAKRFDQAIRVCSKLGLPLVIAGTGAKLEALRRLGGGHVRFTGRTSSHDLRELLRGARALLQPGIEDFGMATAEALACGTPVIAVGRGGVREIVRPRESGLLYPDPQEEALAEALRQFLMEQPVFPRERLQQSVLKFTAARFKTEITAFTSRVMVSFPSPLTREV
ncbi:MAG: glycosyl transferase [Candidatus Andersenbacteria bacterium CG10_big_fil_rev_8_21_14_0_10_54_11]|uniref:Glycosyl transferase n=1 Tax=Candidatus Andersenbacteria bacterium CG10_big_fil_rev_8_21_14_0_10_54_11 TaxID=1974485 RepID=A0A2M6WYG8_9BACT|nr:MAG: glycosyl transferase [Candidatus Andersenbacteria bacterium CG10_big_fil_rev_8_21_14_0_10_54_11]